jgi:hypothetical protein
MNTIRLPRMEFAAERALEQQIEGLRGSGLSSVEVVARLSGTGACQLQRIRPFAELLLWLPEDVRAAELSTGIATRRKMIFAPLLARAREELNSGSPSGWRAETSPS